MYFSLTKTVFVAQYDASLVVLDVEKNSYLSLIGDAATFLQYIISEQFEHTADGIYRPIAPDKNIENNETLSHWINELLQQGIICPTDTPSPKKIHPQAKKSGGLCNYQWDTKQNWVTFHVKNTYQTLRAFITLYTVQRAIHNGGMKALFELIATSKINGNSHNHPSLVVANIIKAVDSATKFWPKKIYCLGWASTFTLEARRQGLPCNLVIGVQTHPFYAHAWAELSDKTVVHDDPQVAEVLSIITRIPEEIV